MGFSEACYGHAAQNPRFHEYKILQLLETSLTPYQISHLEQFHTICNLLCKKQSCFVKVRLFLTISST